MPRFSKLRQTLGLDDTSPKGMGDVQTSDASGRTLPVLQQGWGSPENDNSASFFQGINRGLAKHGIDSKDITPDDIDNYNRSKQLGMTASGGIQSIASQLPELSIDAVKAMQNYGRSTEALGQGSAGQAPPSELEGDDLDAILTKNLGNNRSDRQGSGSRIRFK
jgi:hypothetical protein